MKNKRNRFVVVIVAALIFRLVVAFVVWHPDVRNHMDWGERLYEYGPGGFYAPEANVWNYTWPNQPPGTIYIYAGIYKLYKAVFAGFWWINTNVPAFPSTVMFFLEDNLYPAMLKWPSIAADFGVAWLVYLVLVEREKGVKGREPGKLGAVVYLLNPVVWYNSAVWGQTDAVISFLAMAAFYLLLKRKLVWAGLALTISLYIKISLVIFLPIFVAVALKEKFKLKQAVGAMMAVWAVIGVLTLPFSRGEPWSWLYQIYAKKVLGMQLKVITANAFNIWAALTGIHEQPHSKIFMVFSYQAWGLVLFGLAFIPVVYITLKRKKEEVVWWGLAMTALLSFMLLTNMHERYLYPLFGYLTVLAVRNKKLMMVYWMISVISLLNLYNFWWVPRIGLVITFLSFGDRLMPRVLGALSVLVAVKLYREFLLQTDEMR